MKNWISKNYRAIIISAFLIPIITVAIVSISHVTKWYGISNPVSWAVYLSIGIEIAALSALAAISANMGSKVYFPFGIVTIIQFIGNIYFAYQFIDVNGKEFKDWVELVSSTLEYIGIDPTDVVGHKRFLSLFAGGMLPIISLSFLHMLVKFTQESGTSQQTVTEPTKTTEEIPNTIDSKELVSEISRVRLTDEELNALEKLLSAKSKIAEKEEESKKKDSEDDEKYQNYISKETVSVPLNRITSDESNDELFNDYIDYINELKSENEQKKIDEIEEEVIEHTEAPIEKTEDIIETKEEPTAPVVSEEVIITEEPTPLEIKFENPEDSGVNTETNPVESVKTDSVEEEKKKN